MQCASCGFDNPPSFRFCGSCGAALGEPPVTDSWPSDLGEAAERRQITVLFCEIADAAALSAELDPEQWHEIVRRFQQAATGVIGRFEGYVAQFLGNGLLVYFGYPRAHEDDSRRAVLSALGIVAATADLGSELRAELGFAVATRVGVHTGQVVTGEIGIGAKREQLALGTAPAVAARLQGLAEPGTVLVSAATQRLVQGFFELRLLGSQELKGVRQPMEIYRVLGESGVSRVFELSVSRGLSPLVGRRQELEVLEERYRRALAGRGQVACVTGEAGIGKSRLVHGLRGQLRSGEPPPQWWGCQCSSFSRGSALYPLVELLGEVLGFAGEDPPEERWHKLEGRLERAGMSARETAPILAALLSLPPAQRLPLPELPPPQQKKRTLEALLALLLAKAEQQPAVLVIEDLHWVDPSTVEFLQLLVPRMAGARLLAIFTFRAGFEPPWNALPYVTVVSLDRLSRRQVKTLVGELASKPLPDGVVRHLVDKTDGVPLFVEEMTKSVLESSLLRETEKSFELAGSLASQRIPVTLRDSLMSRLDHLAEARDLAQLAAVVGREFDYEMLRAVSELDDARLELELDRLMAAELVFRHGVPPRATYRFKHALIQDIAYQSLLVKTRKNLHRRIAEVLAGRRERAELVAHHFTAAGEAETAVGYWRQAGEQAFARSAIVEAESHLRRGLELLRELPESAARDREEMALQAVLGAALSTTRGFGAPEVDRAYSRALELGHKGEDVLDLFWVIWGLWRFQFVRAGLAEALELGNRLRRLASSSGEASRSPAYAIAAEFALGATHFCRGELSRALAYLERGIELDRFDRLEHYAAETGEDAGVTSLIWSSFCLWLMGEPEKAQRRFEDAELLAARISHGFTQLYTLAFYSFLLCFRRDLPALRRRSKEVTDRSREHGSWFDGPSYLFYAWAHAADDRLGDEEREDAEGEGFRRTVEEYRARGFKLFAPLFLGMQAEGALRGGRLDEASQCLAEALAVAAESAERFFEPELHRLRGELALAGAGSAAEGRAAPFFERALEVARDQRSKAFELRAALGLGRLLARTGRKAAARDLLAPVVGGFTAGCDIPELAEAGALLDDLSSSRENAS